MPRQPAKKRKEQSEPETEDPSEVKAPSEAEDGPEANWSPWDPTERKVLDIRKLDLDKSYHNEHRPRSNMTKVKVGHTTSKPPPERQRWQHTGQKPIEKVADLPKGWHATEPDLDEA